MTLPLMFLYLEGEIGRGGDYDAAGAGDLFEVLVGALDMFFDLQELEVLGQELVDV